MLTDLREMLAVPVLVFPIGGQTFTVVGCDAGTWLRLQEIHQRTNDIVARAQSKADVAALSQSESTGMTDIDLYKLSLGPVFDQLVAAKVTAEELKHAAMTAYFWQLGEQDLAESLWASAGKAQAPEPKPARRSSTRTSTGAATTTRTRASGSGTNSRRK